MARQIYMGTEKGVYRLETAEGGWQVRSAGLTESYIEAVASHPAGQHALAGTSGQGLFATSNGGTTWEAVTTWTGSPYIRSLAYHPVDSHIVRVGTEPAQVWVSQDSGKTWEEDKGFSGLPGRDRWFLPYSPRAGAVRKLSMLPGPQAAIWAAVEVGGLAGSRDGGAHWQISKSDGGWGYPAGGIHPDVHSVDVLPDHPHLLFAATGGGVFRSRDGGETWQSVLPMYTRGICIQPTDPQTVVAGPARSVGHGGRIMVTEDSGETWRDADANLHFPLPRMCEHIVCDAEHVFAVVLDDCVYCGRFAEGLQWRPVTRDLPPPTCAAIIS